MATNCMNSPGSARSRYPNIRKYGRAPFRVVVVHGGPGAAGEMAPVAGQLGQDFGVLEPLQTAHSVEGQLAELTQLLTDHAEIPVTLIGHSWGAWLSVMLTSRSPYLVAKLLLVASGPFAPEYAAEIAPTRGARLSEGEQRELARIEAAFESATAKEKDILFARYAALSSKTDSFSPIEAPSEVLAGGVGIFEAVWPEAALLRDSGDLLTMAKHITCPIIAIHGDYDTHPVAGVEQPLGKAVKDLQVVLLEKCGHTPWLERNAREAFYAVLARELPRTGNL